MFLLHQLVKVMETKDFVPTLVTNTILLQIGVFRDLDKSKERLVNHCERKIGMNLYYLKPKMLSQHICNALGDAFLSENF